MESVWLVLLALCLGVLIGVGLTVVGVFAARRGRASREASHPSVPDDVMDVLETFESFVVILDSSLNVVYANQAAQRSELVGEDLLRFGVLEEVAAQALSHDEIVTIELRDDPGEIERLGGSLSVPHDDPALHNLWVRGARLGSRLVLVIVEDRGEAWRLDAMRRDFIANVSHELKTPVSAVSLLSEALLQAADDPDMVVHFAGRLTRESARLADLTSDIIRLSSAQVSAPALTDEPVEVSAIFDRAAEEHRNVAEQRRISVVWGDATGLRVAGDADSLVTALGNLVGNALNYSADGSHVGIGAHLVGDNIEIAVTDQGVGIPPEDVDRIFERFYRVDQARSRDTGGTGLGLSIVKNTVQGHGGDVRVWSQLGSGSTFTIVLPAYRPPQPRTESLPLVSGKTVLKHRERHPTGSVVAIDRSALDAAVSADKAAKAKKKKDKKDKKAAGKKDKKRERDASLAPHANTADPVSAAPAEHD